MKEKEAESMRLKRSDPEFKEKEASSKKQKRADPVILEREKMRMKTLRANIVYKKKEMLKNKIRMAMKRKASRYRTERDKKLLLLDQKR